MKTLTHPLFLFCSGLFILNQIMERLGVVIPFIHSYLDDLVCLPLTLTIALFLQQKLTGIPNYVLSKNKIIMVWIFYSVHFELWIPQVNLRYTADYIDVLVYGVGGLVFYYFLNQPNLKTKGYA